MEPTNIVYSSTLIFLLILSSLIVVGFLLLQCRKNQLNFSERKTKTRNISYLSNTPPVSADVYYLRKYHSTEAKSENTIKFKYYNEEPVQRKKMSKSLRPVKPVSRGSLVREHYNADSFLYSNTEINKDIIRFN